MIEELTTFFNKPKEETQGQVPAGLCPNCWGEQEYDHTIRKMFKDKQIDVKNHKANHAFIQNFVVTRVNGIRLIKGNNGLVCPTCHTIRPNP